MQRLNNKAKETCLRKLWLLQKSVVYTVYAREGMAKVNGSLEYSRTIHVA